MRLKDITSEKWEFIIDHAEKLDQGVNLWYKNVPYPRRIYWDFANDPNYTLWVLKSLGTVKKTFFALIHLKGVVFPYRFNVKKYESFLEHLSMVIDWNLQEYYLQDKDYSVPVWEIGTFIQNFLSYIGINIDLSGAFARFARMFLEFDNAYRNKLQDLAGVVDMDILKKYPRKEIKRVLDIYLDRNIWYKGDMNFGARARITRVIDLLLLLLLIPKVKRAFIKALETIDIEKIKFNDNDRFHVSYWIGYNFEGKEFEERFKPYEEIFKNATYRKREDPQKIASFMTGE